MQLLFNDARLFLPQVQRVFKEHAKNLTMSVVTSYKLNLVKPSLTIKLLRPPNWYNYTSVTPLENRLRVELQNKASLKLLFGNSKNITLHGLIMGETNYANLFLNVHGQILSSTQDLVATMYGREPCLVAIHLDLHQICISSSSLYWVKITKISSLCQRGVN